MAIPSYMMGLLGQDESLAPELGILGRIGSGGVDPIRQAMAQRVAQQGQGQGPPVPPLPQVQTPPPLPQEDFQSNIPDNPVISPTGMGLLAAGGAVEDAPSFASAVSRALGAGVPAFLASKQQKQQTQIARRQEAAYQDSLDSPELRNELSPSQLKLLRGMSSGAGQQLLTRLLTEKDPIKVGKDEKLVDRKGKAIAEGTQGVTEVGGRGFQRDKDGNLIEVIAAAAPKPTEATTDIKDFAAGNNLDPDKFRQWTPEQGRAFQEWQARQNATKATRVSTHVALPAGESQFMQTYGGKLAEQAAQRRLSAINAPNAISSIDDALELLQSGQVYTGAASGAQLAGAKLMYKVLGGDDSAITTTEKFNTLLQNQLIARLDEMGPGMKSDNDMVQLRAAVGNMKNNRASQEAILKRARKVLNKIIEKSDAETADIAKNAPAKSPVLGSLLKPVGKVPSRNPSPQQQNYDALVKQYGPERTKKQLGERPED